jgi:flagellar basal body P-ring formation protein FlgA
MKSILTLALLLAIPAAAVAQTADDTPLAPALKQNVIVTSDLVRIGDLVENAGAASQIAIFRAPDLGSTGTVPVARIVEAVRAHDVFAINTRGMNEITVTRASRSIANKDFEEKIASAIASQYRMGEAKNIGITFDRGVSSIQAEPGNNSDLTITRLTFDPRSGRFDATLDLPGSNAVRRGSLRFTGIAAEVLDTAVLTRPLARGEVLRANDIVIERKPKRELMGDSVADSGLAVGMAARAPLRAGQPLRRADLMKPELVSRNEQVTLIFQAPGLSLTVRGTAMEPGTEGDVIGVTNIQTKRQLQGVVTGPGQVTVSTMKPRITASLDSQSVAGTPRRSAQ